MYALCDFQTCYTNNFIIYCGTQKPGPFVTSNRPFHVVKCLNDPLIKSNRNITSDSWFSSYPLAEYLLTIWMTFLGALRKNKSDIPPDFVTENKKLVPGSHIFECNYTSTLVSLVTKKQNVVLILSTLHEGNELDDETRKPVQIMDY